MAWSARWVLCLCLGWGCLYLALGDALRPRRLGLRRRAAPGAVRAGRARAAAGEDGEGQGRPGRPAAADRVAEHMLRLYEQYRDPPTPAGPWLRRGNTVRGFRPLPSGECAPRPEKEGSTAGSEHRWGGARRARWRGEMRELKEYPFLQGLSCIRLCPVLYCLTTSALHRASLSSG